MNFLRESRKSDPTFSDFLSGLLYTALTIIWLVVVVSVSAKMTATDDNFNDDAFMSF